MWEVKSWNLSIEKMKKNSYLLGVNALPPGDNCNVWVGEEGK